MGIEYRSFSEGEIHKENPDEMIIFEDGNHPGSYFRGRRSEKQLLVNEGGYPLEEIDPTLNELGQIWAPTEWDESGNVTKEGWRNVLPIPDHWREETDENLPADL